VELLHQPIRHTQLGEVAKKPEIEGGRLSPCAGKGAKGNPFPKQFSKAFRKRFSRGFSNRMTAPLRRDCVVCFPFSRLRLKRHRLGLRPKISLVVSSLSTGLRPVTIRNTVANAATTREVTIREEEAFRV
jgi:hypothetical protein